MNYETRVFPLGEKECKEHCYHHRETSKLGDHEICCRCGTKSIVRRKIEVINKSHGPFWKGE